MKPTGTTCPECYCDNMRVKVNSLGLQIGVCPACHYATTTEFISGYWYAARDIIQRGKLSKIYTAIREMDKE